MAESDISHRVILEILVEFCQLLLDNQLKIFFDLHTASDDVDLHIRSTFLWYLQIFHLQIYYTTLGSICHRIFIEII